MLVVEESNIQTREATIIRWYKEVFPHAAAYIQRQGGDLEEAKEIFQEALVSYYEKCSSSDFQPAVGDQAYLMGIVKKQWLKYRKSRTGNQSLDHIEVTEEKMPKPQAEKLLQYLKRAGEKCMGLLQSFYYEKLTMRQVADRFSYSSERSATVQKYKCLEKVRDEIKQRSLNHEDFLD
ncbi:MAG: sigma-70 family RNA polymerase sigma factor [Bacteroidota bacterium]